MYLNPYRANVQAIMSECTSLYSTATGYDIIAL